PFAGQDECPRGVVDRTLPGEIEELLPSGHRLRDIVAQLRESVRRLPGSFQLRPGGEKARIPLAGHGREIDVSLFGLVGPAGFRGGRAYPRAPDETFPARLQDQVAGEAAAELIPVVL